MRKRGKYRPRLAGVNPLFVLESMERLSAADRLHIKTHMHSSMTEIVQGRGTTEAWNSLAGTIMIASWLSAPGKLYPEAEDTFNMAWKCLINAIYRFHQGKSMGFTGLELRILNTALLIHDEQIDNANIGQMEKAREYAISLFDRLAYPAVIPRIAGLQKVTDENIYVLD